MKHLFTLTTCLVLFAVTGHAQTTAMQFTGTDCNGNAVDLFADLDAGKAVVLFYYMPSCGSCPPPAQQIQAMAMRINADYPGRVKGYAYPYQNSTTCSYSATWVSSNGLSMYAPMDSGATQVAYYGGFGMPTVVLVGGADHKVLFSTQSFSAGDTSTMRTAILNLFNATSAPAIHPAPFGAKIYPNPASDMLQVDIRTSSTVPVHVAVLNLMGEAVLPEQELQAGAVSVQIPTHTLAAGLYMVRLTGEPAAELHRFAVAR